MGGDYGNVAENEIASVPDVGFAEFFTNPSGGVFVLRKLQPQRGIERYERKRYTKCAKVL